MDGQIFHTVDIAVTVPGDATAPDPARGWGVAPWGALTRLAEPLEAVEILRFSDVGYVSETHTAWPPLLQQAYSLDRRLDLRPDARTGDESWGALVLSDPNGLLDHVVATRVVDHMPIRVRYGRRGRDALRGCAIDPPERALRPAFSGLGRSWQPDRQSVEIALADATAWLDAPAQTQVYAGTGGVEGGPDLAGRYRPKLRGIALNITPVAVDPARLVYQLSDAPGTIEALYEGGFAGGIAFAGTVADVFAHDPPPGHYVVQSDASGLWIRLGTRPVWAITLDATGALPDGTSASGLLALLRGALLQDCQLAPALFDAAWEEASAETPWPGGWYWDGNARLTGREIADTLLAGLGVRLVASRTGTLKPVVVQRPHGTAVARFGPHNVIAVAPVALDAVLDPPPARWRVGYAHAHTVQAQGSGLSPQVSPARQGFIGQADRLASWASADLRRRYRVPNDPDPLVTALAREQDAAALAARHGALWGGTCRLRAITVPLDPGYAVDLGDRVTLALPEHPGRVLSALVVGEQIRPDETTMTLQLLVGESL
ncbi:hypothetical protein [Swaminathania salitolerans]|uniref:Tail protein n=1 Tax=Swaminathania salitolerans TaxID=182838 RepID=A0A511BNE9_9PROT|nr:hypothetical protein [Swaminathania salitolerans]GBQ14722.1 hypothetical protein AA21291_1935 [Swaminathania salitolerans LMG 21291]GEL01866.1 hypothetical protein SSA02_10290 [Swaminathania salitolerans]